MEISKIDQYLINWTMREVCHCGFHEGTDAYLLLKQRAQKDRDLSKFCPEVKPAYCHRTAMQLLCLVNQRMETMRSALRMSCNIFAGCLDEQGGQEKADEAAKAEDLFLMLRHWEQFAP